MHACVRTKLTNMCLPRYYINQAVPYALSKAVDWIVVIEDKKNLSKGFVLGNGAALLGFKKERRSKFFE